MKGVKVIQVKLDRVLEDDELVELEEFCCNLADEAQCGVHILHTDAKGLQIITPRKKRGV